MVKGWSGFMRNWNTVYECISLFMWHLYMLKDQCVCYSQFIVGLAWTKLPPPPLYCLAVQCVREDWQISLKNLWLMTKRQSSMQQKRSKMIENLAPKKCICVKAHLILCSKSSLNFVKKYMTFAIMLSCSQQNIKNNRKRRKIAQFQVKDDILKWLFWKT